MSSIINIITSRWQHQMGDSNSTPADTTSTPTEETSGQPGRPTSPHSKLRFQCKLARLANRRKDVCFKSCKKSQKNCDFFVIFAPETCDFRNGLVRDVRDGGTRNPAVAGHTVRDSLGCACICVLDNSWKLTFFSPILSMHAGRHEPLFVETSGDCFARLHMPSGSL